MTRARRALACALALACAAGLAACTADTSPDPGPTAPSASGTTSPVPEPQSRAAGLRLPDAPTTVLPAGGPALAAAASAALFDSAPVVVLAADGDVAAQVRAASVAVGLGAPLLLAGGDEPDAWSHETERLGAVAAVVVGASSLVDEARATLPEIDVVTGAPAELAAASGATPAERVEVAPGGEVAAVAALDRDRPALLVAGPSSAPSSSAAPSSAPSPAPSSSAPSSSGPSSSAPTLPRLARPAPLARAALVTDGTPGTLAAVATARAAGLPAAVVSGADPRASAADVRALAAAASPDATLLTAGPAFAAAPDPRDLDWRLRTAATGVELPGGGQLVFPGHRLVALYGTPGDPRLGVLGEQDAAASVARAKDLAAAYQALTPDTVVPAFEIIATIADRDPGPDGNYSRERSVDELRPWVDAAAQAGLDVVLDLQPGRTDFLTQAQQYAELLERPNVGLALDPEWRLAPDQLHLKQIGSVDAAEVNAVSAWLAGLTREHRLPQKVLVLHQFAERMIRDRATLDLSHPELATVLHVDGQGSQPAKAGTWAALRRDAPAGLWWGWKNFVDEDVPMLTPEQTVQVSPVPDLVTYQ